MLNTLVGPAGGLGGELFNGYMVPEGGHLQTVKIQAGTYIEAIQLVYTDGDGGTIELPLIGSRGEAHGTTHHFSLHEGEYLTGISGRADWYIDSLRLHTNLRESEVYGGDGGGTEFSLQAPANTEVVGFFGRADWYIDSLGLVVRGRATAVVPVDPASLAMTVTETPAETTRKAKPKDLQKVEGIGPKIAGLLVEAGILDLADLAKAPVSKLEAVLASAGPRFKMHDPSTWAEQAALGAKGDWDALKALQDELSGGRRAE